MDLAPLWIDELFISLLWVAAFAAIIGGVKRRWLRISLMTPVILIPLAALGAFVALTATLKFRLKFEPDRFYNALSLLLAFLMGTAVILWRATASWRRGPLVLALLAAVVVGCVTLYSMDLANRTRCAILSAKLKSEYLASLPEIASDAQNAAPIYLKALARLSDDNEDAVQNPPIGATVKFNPNDPGTIAFLARQAPTVALLRQAATMSACRFDVDLRDLNIGTIDTILPQFNQYQNAANLLNLHARESIARGNASLAVEDAAAMFAMSRHFGHGPMVVCALVGIGIAGSGIHTLEESLPAVKSRDELAPVRRLNDLPPISRMFEEGLRGDERMDLSFYENSPTNWFDDVRVPSTADDIKRAFLGVYFYNIEAYLQHMQKGQDLALLPYFEIRGQLPPDTPIAGFRRDDPYVFFTSLTDIQNSPQSMLFAAIAASEAREACAQTAVAMTRYRLDHGTLPSRLDDLVPTYMDAVPINPFDGHLLRLVVKQGKWIIYCDGLDGINHGGEESTDHSKGGVVFKLAPAPDPSQLNDG